MRDAIVEKLGYTVKEVCVASTLGETKVREDIRAGRLKAQRKGTRWIINIDSLREYLGLEG